MCRLCDRGASSRAFCCCLQAQLSAQAQQLVAVMQQLPGAQQVLECQAAAAAAAQRARGGGLTVSLRWAWQRLSHVLGYSSTPQHSSSSSSAAAAAPDAIALQRLRFGLAPELLQQQVSYVLALSRMLPHIQQLVAAATQARSLLLQAARHGAFDAAGGSGSSRDNGQRAGGSAAVPWRGAAGVTSAQPQQQLTALDVVGAGGSVYALSEVVSEGLGSLWRAWQGQQ